MGWRIGELAEETGLTVRTLHHYDDIGLLRPAARTDAGHRIYEDGDVARLYRIIALRQLGLRLEEIGDVLDREPYDPRVALKGHLEELDRELTLQRQLRDRLHAVLQTLDAREDPSTADLLRMIELMIDLEDHYTPEQLASIERRRREVGEDAIRAAEAEWARLIAEAEAHAAAGTPPSDPDVQRIAARWSELVTSFHGGDPDLADAVRRLWEDRGDDLRDAFGGPSPEAVALVQAAEQHRSAIADADA